ncbi:MAG TPA: hypothetical protein VGD78_22610 [Chthoniobacterales bacterium]
MKAKFLCLLAVCFAFPAVLVAQLDEKKAIVGVWEVTISPTGQLVPQTGKPVPPILSLATFGADGSFITTIGRGTVPPVPALQGVADEIGPAYGRWFQTTAREFRLTFYHVMLKEGAVNGFVRVQSTDVLSDSGNEFAAHGQADFLDANWNVVFSVTTEVKGTRLETPGQP